MSDSRGPDRRSRLASPHSDARLLYADLHNHSLLSDGTGDPEQAFTQLREAGLDVAALTDHASIPRHALAGLSPDDYPDEAAFRTAHLAPNSVDEAGWRRTASLADAADVPGEFTAIRGFEWTEPWLGHANVWFSADYLPVDTPGRVDGLHRWLTETEPDALFGYNHPGREPGRFHDFLHLPGLAPRLVALEAFNRMDDYLFEGWRLGRPSPLTACLDAGWRPGLVGVSDEHGRRYGLVGKGRTGLWATEHSRAGVRAALLARHTYATREVGLLLDATLDGVQMGGEVPAAGVRREPVDVVRRELAVDLRSGPALDGTPVELQVLCTGDDALAAPAVIACEPAQIGAVTRVEVHVDPEVTPWLLLRIADPARRNVTPGPAGHPANSYALAYASPWSLSARP